MEPKYTITLTREELKMIRKSLRSTNGSIRKLLDNCLTDSLSEETCIDMLFKYHELINKLDDAMAVDNK